MTKDGCAGPNHGVVEMLPPGHRHWTPGHCLSLTQTVEDGLSSYMIFCSSDCLCDWHGAACVCEKDAQAILGDDEEIIPGTFTLAWISPARTTLGRYDSFTELTEHIGAYQQRLLALTEGRDPDTLPDTL